MKTEYKIPKSVRHPTENSKDENVCRTLTKKVCTACKLEKDIEVEFYTRTNGKKHASCKKCQLDNKKRYYQENKKAKKEYRKEYYQKNKKKVRKTQSNYRKKRLKKDPCFKLLLASRNHVYQFLKYEKKLSTIQYLGCSLKQLKNYLESKFLPGMTWENHGIEGWHIDHILPLSQIDLNNEEEKLKALHYTNLQPLWAKDNLSKGNKIL